MSEIDYKSQYEALVLRLKNDEGLGVYPMGHMSAEERDGDAIKKTDAYKCGWNDAVLQDTRHFQDMIKDTENDSSDDLSMLLASGMCFYSEGTLSLNMNDTWAWACSDIPEVPASEIREVARLFRDYGHPGLMYWHSLRENNMRSEFHDNNRAIDFVRHEEQIRKETPDDNKRAYRKVTYILGEDKLKDKKSKKNLIARWLCGENK